MREQIEIEPPQTILSASETETVAVGRSFGEKLNRGDIVALSGELGSGKTRIVQGICAAFEVIEMVTSPTFTIVHQYTGRNGKSKPVPLYHIDCYRIGSVDDLLDIGIDEFISGGAICMIEWPEIVIPLLRGGYWRIHLEMGSQETQRLIHIEYTDAGRR